MERQIKGLPTNCNRNQTRKARKLENNTNRQTKAFAYLYTHFLDFRGENHVKEVIKVDRVLIF